MFNEGFDVRVKTSQIVQNQVPQFISDENTAFIDFLKQYYISQEYQGGPTDILDNLDQYLKLDNLIKDNLTRTYTLQRDADYNSDEILVDTTLGFPDHYGLLKIGNEIITYTEKTETSFIGCVRGFSGIESLQKGNFTTELVFNQSNIESHSVGDPVENLSTLFLKEFYKKIKSYLTPELENLDFVHDLNVGTFIKEASTLYKSKGTEESFRILFNVLYGVTPSLINLEDHLIKPSSAEFIRRKVIYGELIEGQKPASIVGQTLISSDGTANGPISSVEIVNKNNKVTYKISLFEGYDDRSLINGEFDITASTKCIGGASVGSNTITVDSTIGFPQSGSIISGDNLITYTEKTVNQFLNCSGIENAINDTDVVQDHFYVYSYEDGDTDRIVRFSVSNILAELNFPENTNLTNDDEGVNVINLGDNVTNPDNKTYKELLFNTWFYNTSSRYQVERSQSNTTHQTKEKVDRSSLRVGDVVEVVDRFDNVVYGYGSVSTASGTEVKLESYVNTSGIDVTEKSVDLKRRLKTARSTSAELKYPNLLANIQNVYSDGDEYAYVATNSLPGFNIDSKFASRYIDVADQDSVLNNSIIFPQSVLPLPFITGDELIYTSENEETPIIGLESGKNYFVKVISEDTIRLFASKSFIYTNNYLDISVSSFVFPGRHSFSLKRQYNKKIASSKSLRKITLNPKINSGQNQETVAGKPVAMLVNGTEIISYKGTDKVYYGPIKSRTIYNVGSNYDVINPPKLVVGAPTVSAGTTALITPVISGSINSILLSTPEVEVNDVSYVRIIGGNGSGCVLNPIIETRQNEFEFSAKDDIDIFYETISFPREHYLQDGQEVIYSANGNSPIGRGDYGGSNANLDQTLLNGGLYYVKVFNSKSIQLFGNQTDFNAGINTVGFTTVNNTGIHKIKTVDYKKVLVDIAVEDGGSGYTNRKLIVNSSDISVADSTINFSSHGFSDGDLLKYDSENPISGLSTDNQYYVIKMDDDRFRLANAGVGGTISSDYERKDYVKFQSEGSGYQTFNYPDIIVDIGVSYANTSRTIQASPIVRGSIVDTYIYEQGNNYGSTILNYHNKPIVSVRTGKDATVRPVILNGKIVDVVVETKGSEYHSIPDLIINGTGSGAKLNPVISDGKLQSVIVIKGGIGYGKNTEIAVRSPGSEFNIDLNVRDLTVNNHFRFGSEYLNSFGALRDDEVLYSILGYSDNLRNSFLDNVGTESEPDHSPIIGWAYDGNPIYGSFGYSNPNDTSTVKLLTSGYKKYPELIVNRPSLDDFPDGFFIEDFNYDGSGDLDIYNGRYSKTPEFPNGVYAYYATIESSPTTIGSYIPQFPYYIGKYYKSQIETGVFNLNQENFDFESSRLQRNTFPYRIGEIYSSTDYVDFVYDKGTISANIEEASKGGILEFDIIDPGRDYKVGDTIIVDNTGSSGFGVSASVYSVNGKTIDSILTSIQSYENIEIIKHDDRTTKLYLRPYHELEDDSFITINQASTYIAGLAGIKRIGVTTSSSFILKEIPENNTVGLVTDIYVAEISNEVSIGSSIRIGEEIMSVMNIFDLNRVLRVKRDVGSAHTQSSVVDYLPEYFTIDLSIDDIDSKINRNVFFNPTQSVGIGTISGQGVEVDIEIGEVTKKISVDTQSIYLPNHPFKNNQLVRLHKPEAASGSFIVYDESQDDEYYLPGQLDAHHDVYIINKGDDYIGISTLPGSEESLYFKVNASDDFNYRFESFDSTITTDGEVLRTTVTTTENHALTDGDLVDLSLISGKEVGIGLTRSSVSVRYNEDYNKILLDKVGFGSESIVVDQNKIVISNHKYETGTKLFYEHANESASGLSTGEYFVLKLDKDSFKIGETYRDVISDPPSIVSIASTGGSGQSFSLVNPPITLVDKDTLVFDVSDSSLSGTNLNFFYDRRFINEFVSTGSSSEFNIVRTGVIGVGTASIKLRPLNGLNSDLFYTLRKGIENIKPDYDVKNYSSIKTVPSDYNGKYKVIGAGTTTFDIVLRKRPERVSYASTEIETLSYTTTSENASGGINEIRPLFSGVGYTKLPKFNGLTSDNGINAKVKLSTENIGRINDLRIRNEGIIYPSDITLSPKGRASLICNIVDNQEVTSVDIVYGGTNYYAPPTFVCVNSKTRESIEGVAFEASLSSGSISDIKIISSPRGLASVSHEIYPTNNTNGINIRTIGAPDQSGKILCTLSTPIVGFSTFAPPFEVGDEVFLEGIEKEDDGKGFNSEDYGYKFFKVTNYYPLNPAIVEVDLGEAPGTPKTLQSFAQIINKKIFPTFTTYQENSKFLTNESIYVNYGGGYIKTDYIVVDDINNYVKLKGKGFIQNNILIKGEKSGSIARIESFKYNDGNFVTAATAEEKGGWNDEVGLLSSDLQVTGDNDYYQSLSYSIRSSITFDQLTDNVNRVLHPTGLKNFADLQISNNVSIDVLNQGETTLIVDFIDELRVDEKNAYDLVLDSTTSQFKTRDIRFLNKKLTDYFKCKTNRVLPIDDISDRFSSKIFGQERYVDIQIYPSYLNYSRYLVQTFGSGNDDYQLDDVVVINDSINAYTINRGQVGNTYEPVVDLYGNMEEGVMSFRFAPNDPEDSSYNIKSLRGYYDTSLSGIGSTTIGNSHIITKTEQVLSGVSTNFVQIPVSETNGMMCEVFVKDNLSTEMNFFELAIDHDGTDAQLAEYYIDTLTRTSGISGTPLGSFNANIENGVLNVSFASNSNNTITLKSKVYNFEPTTTAGISTYRFLSPGQPDGSERTARIDSRHNVVAIATDAVNASAEVVSIDISTDASFKSLIKINHLEGTSIHQVLFGYDGEDTYVLPKYYISIGSTSGIGTFGSSVNATNANLLFYPDAGVTGRFDITTYNEIIYRDVDLVNTDTELEYGTTIEEIISTKYNSLNGDGNDQLDFVLKHDDVPIFEKTINPTTPNIVDKDSGIIYIDDHFFSNGEEIEYIPTSTYVGISAGPIGIGTTTVGGTVFRGTIISGLSTITGIKLTSELDNSLIQSGYLVEGYSIPDNTTIVSVGQTFQYFTGDVVGSASSILTGIANTSIFDIGSGVFDHQDGSLLGNIEIIGLDEIYLDTSVNVGSYTLYTDNLGLGVELSNPGTATTYSNQVVCGLVTDKMPSTLYVIRDTKDSFKVTGTKNSGVGFTFTDYGEGNAHKFGMKKKNEKVIITIDNIIQYPILYTEIVHNLENNIGMSTEFAVLSGISSVNPRDLVRINDEYLRINNVGYGSSAGGPITGIGTFKLIEFDRAFVGSSATSHNIGDTARVYKGSYNIVNDKIFFTEAPKGIGDNARRNDRNLPLTKSAFNGRVFLRNDYTSNLIYDDLSPNFTGIAQTFTIKREGQNVDYVEPGSGILFINETFQTPTTENNEGNNYGLVSENSQTKITFSGIRSPETNELIVSDYDVNQNQLPRGGIILSMGSTSGLGYAPLVGASVTAVLDSNGSIVSVGLGTEDIVGSGYYGSVGVEVFDPNHVGDDASITATVGAGGTLTFNVGAGGTGYTETIKISVPSPSYENLEVVGISRLGIGATTETGDGLLLTLDVNASSRRMSGRWSDAANLLLRNKELIAEVAVGRMVDFYGGAFSVPGGNENCSDDIEGVIESIAHNLEFSGNDKVYDSAKIYVDNAYLAGEEEESIRAYQEAASLMIQAMRNEPITIGGYSTRTQYTDLSITVDPEGAPYCADVASAIDSFVGIVTTAIGNGTLPSRTSSYLDLYEVSDFKISRAGYNFRRGDVITAVGLVTAAHLAQPQEQFQIEVLGTFTDSSALWQFGELDYIDSIKPYQTTARRRFPLYRNNELISFEVDPTDPDSILINLEALLVIFVNGILQEPNRAYQFYGGTSIIFTDPIKPEDDVDIFFYRGTRGEDSYLQQINPELKKGDFVRIKSNRSIPYTQYQEPRLVFDILESDLLETNVYNGVGIDTTNPRPISIIPQKRDRIINSVVVTKSREILSSQIYPTSKIIKSITSSDYEIFVDDAQSFFYESKAPLQRTISEIDAIMVDDVTLSSASAIASVKLGGLTEINVTNQGSGYESAPTVEIGEGSSGSATANLSSTGFVKRIEITDGGSGYTYPPIVTFGGGLASQSGTASITNGVVTQIELDGITFDTTDSDDIYEFGGGTSIAPNGSGSGSTGGFNIGSTHLRFGDSSGTRFVTLNPIDARSINTVRVYAVRGNGSNGGETPDVVGVEDLRIQYQITDPGEAPNNNNFIDLGVVIPAVANGTGTGVLDNYDFNLPSDLQVGHVYFRLYQEGNSGPNYDHYGILSVSFIGDASAEIPDSTITLSKNPLEPNPGSILDATAQIILGKRVESITVNSAGTGYTLNSTVTLTGGDYISEAAAEISEIGGYVGIVTVTSGGNGYSPSTYLPISVTSPQGIGVTATGVAVINSNGNVESISLDNVGIGYTQAPFISIPPPSVKVENIKDINFVTGFSGIITGITTSTGVGTDLSLQFNLHVENNNFATLQTGYPIYVYNTQVGNGVTSIDSDDSSVVGVGTTFLDNIYYVHSITSDGENAVVTANIKSDSNIVGIPANGTNIGKFSWGRLTIDPETIRTDAISFDLSNYTVAGLSSYPQIQRRGYGLRDTGSLAY